jgi:BirA family transcriptional regulator, biotin operon repressor / biotin---[acetyl-CoA-carboxylase] ligase
VNPSLRFEAIDSTQREARRRALAGAPTGTTIVAARQTAGIGRLDHGWHSPAGGLYLSRIAPDPRVAPGLATLSVAVAVRSALAARASVGLAIRWPNDLWTEPAPGRRYGKLAGVLADRLDRPDGPVLVVGVGVNVAPLPPDAPAGLRDRAVSLSELSGSAVELLEVERAVLEALEKAERRMATAAGATGTLEAARAALEGRGRRVALDGREAGRIRGLADDGALVVERPDGTTREELAGTLAYLDA